jgi:hypothetical protein
MIDYVNKAYQGKNDKQWQDKYRTKIRFSYS